MLVFRYRGLKKDIIDIIFLMIFFLTLLFLCGGCAGAGRGYYQTPCSPPHLIKGKEAEELKRGKDDNAVIKCPECGTVFPAELLVKKSRHTCDGDEVKWYHGLGWHWTGPYRYGRPYPYYGGSYYYRQHHYGYHYGRECDRHR